VNFEIVTSNQRLMELWPEWMCQQWLAIDTETTGLDWQEDFIGGISLSYDSSFGYYVPFNHSEGPQCNPLVVKWVMEGILRNPRIAKIFHNAKFDLHMIKSTFGFKVVGPIHDTLLMGFLIDNTVDKNLKDWSARLFGPELKDKEKELKAHLKQIRAPTYMHLPIDIVGPYAAGDAVATWRLFEVFKPQVWNTGLYWTEIGLIPLLVQMERTGVQINRQYLIDGGVKIDQRIPEVQTQLDQLAGHPINPGSPKQVADLLYKELGLPVLMTTAKGVPSTAEEVLINLPPHPAVQLILEARSLAKCKSTYIEGIQDKLDSHNRLHCRFNQAGAETGRFSSSEPNLQNIPREGSMPVSIRGAFVPSPGRVLVFVDYKQIEMRVFAHYSGDPDLIAACRSGFDFHLATAAIIFAKPTDAITTEERKFAKKVNFGYIYGIGSAKLARELQVSRHEAQKFLDRYDARFPGVPQYVAQCRADFEHKHYVENLFGRRRFIPWDKAYRAVNTTVQGTAADIIKVAMVHLEDLLARLRSKLILQVHDELVFDTVPEELDQIPTICKIMEDFKLRVPIEVDVKWSDVSWAAKKPWTSPTEIRESLGGTQ